MIRVEHLTKTYGPRVAVADVSFTVEKGEILGFLGPNGAGKTTTMRMLVGIMAPAEGRAEVLGFDTVRESELLKAPFGDMPPRIVLVAASPTAQHMAFFT